MHTERSCSHCHTMNTLVLMREGTTNEILYPLRCVPAYCRCCGHRADVCRSECDCPRCRPELLRVGLALLTAPSAN